MVVMTKPEVPPQTSAADAARRRRLGRWKMLVVVAVCAAPLIASYLTYYVIKPQSRNNYGEPCTAVRCR